MIIEPNHYLSRFQSEIEAAVLSSGVYPSGLAGRGIVLWADGDQDFANAWVTIRMLRLLGCRLPIQLWYADLETLAVQMRSAIETYDVQCVDSCEFTASKKPVSTLLELKTLAIVRSPFATVLALDQGIVPIRDPEYLFEQKPFKETGAIFWRGARCLPDNSVIGEAIRQWYGDDCGFDAGQMVIDKTKCWKPLNLAFWLHGNFPAPRNDGNAYWLAWHTCRQPFATPDQGFQALGLGASDIVLAALCHHDFGGDRIFQCRKIAPWRLFGRNESIPGYFFEGECRSFLKDLQVIWDRFTEKGHREGSLALMQTRRELMGQSWLMEPVEAITSEDCAAEATRADHSTEPGEDAQVEPMKWPQFDEMWPKPKNRIWREFRFDENGTLGCYSDETFTFWKLIEAAEETALLLAGPESPSITKARLTQQSDGSWAGTWLSSWPGKEIRLFPVTHVYPAAVGNSQPRRHGPITAIEEQYGKRIHLFTSSADLADQVVGIYACVGIADAGIEVCYHTRFPEWMDRVSHPNLTISGELPPGILDRFMARLGIPQVETSPGANTSPAKPVLDLNVDLPMQRRYGHDLASWYTSSVSAHLSPKRPAAVDRAVRIPRFDFTRYVVIFPIAKAGIQQWPFPHWTRLIHLIKQAGYEVVAIGAQEQQKNLGRVCYYTTAVWALSHSADWVIDTILGASAVVCGHDDMAQIGGLLGVPTYAIHGTMTPEAAWACTDIIGITPRTACTFCRFQPERGYVPACNLGCSAAGTIGPEEVFARILAELRGAD